MSLVFCSFQVIDEYDMFVFCKLWSFDGPKMMIIQDVHCLMIRQLSLIRQ